jgi:hypothetical protein
MNSLIEVDSEQIDKHIIIAIFSSQDQWVQI